MTFRPLLTLIAVTLTAALPSLAAAKTGDLSIVRVYPGWREAASFKRISEYFDGKENTRGEAVIRTHSDQRGGFYFLVRTANPGAARSIKANLEIITSANAQPRHYSFLAEVKSGDTVLHLGLTGPDWPDAKASPVAWKLELSDADGRLLATEKSYLWEKPAAN